MMVIDGSLGEGGGQILRTSLALSLMTQKPFKIEKIRAGRQKPGIMRQHLTSVQAAQRISNAEISGAVIGSQELTFRPQTVVPGDYRFSIGTAGSTTLVLQTILPVLLTASGRSALTLEGGTHNPAAPPFDFIARSYLPLINRMGPTCSAKLDRYGFFPAGGGKISVTVEPTQRLSGFDLHERGEILDKRAKIVLSALPREIAEREVARIQKKMSWMPAQLNIEEVDRPVGHGNVIMIEIVSEHVTEIFTGFGERGVRAETIAEEVAKEARNYLTLDVPVWEHLADQLLLPLSMAGRGSFLTITPSKHTRTNIEVIKKFLDLDILTTQKTRNTWVIQIHGKT